MKRLYTHKYKNLSTDNHFRLYSLMEMAPKKKERTTISTRVIKIRNQTKKEGNLLTNCFQIGEKRSFTGDQQSRLETYFYFHFPPEETLFDRQPTTLWNLSVQRNYFWALVWINLRVNLYGVFGVAFLLSSLRRNSPSDHLQLQCCRSSGSLVNVHRKYCNREARRRKPGLKSIEFE